MRQGNDDFRQYGLVRKGRLFFGLNATKTQVERRDYQKPSCPHPEVENINSLRDRQSGKSHATTQSCLDGSVKAVGVVLTLPQAILHAPNPKRKAPGAGRRVNGGAVRL